MKTPPGGENPYRIEKKKIIAHLIIKNPQNLGGVISLGWDFNLPKNVLCLRKKEIFFGVGKKIKGGGLNLINGVFP